MSANHCRFILQGAISTFAKSLAIDEAGNGVRVNA